MTSFDFVEGAIPEKLITELDLDLFLQPLHLNLQSPSGWVSFYLVDKQTEKLLSFIHFHVTANEALSPLKSPYGSFWFLKDIQPAALFEFIQFCEKALHNKGVHRIQITNPPSLFQQNAALLNVLLHNLNYQVLSAEMTSVIEITSAEFLSGANQWEKRKYHMARKKGFESKSLSVDQLENVYTFISTCRQIQGRQLSMPLEEIRRILEKFPNRIFLFAVFDRDKMIASSINILVNKRVMYHFYGAHDAAYNKVSPVVMMMNEIYNHCRKTEINYLDMGTSALADKPSFALLDFKTSLGAVISEKLTFQKKLQ